MAVAVVGVQWMLSGSVWNESWGISAKNGKCVAMVLLRSLRFACCFMVRFVEWLIMGK